MMERILPTAIVWQCKHLFLGECYLDDHKQFTDYDKAKIFVKTKINVLVCGSLADVSYREVIFIFKRIKEVRIMICFC